MLVLRTGFGQAVSTRLGRAGLPPRNGEPETRDIADISSRVFTVRAKRAARERPIFGRIFPGIPGRNVPKGERHGLENVACGNILAYRDPIAARPHYDK